MQNAGEREAGSDPRQPDSATRHQEAADQDHRQGHSDFAPGQTESREVQRGTEEASGDQRQDAPHPALDQGEKKSGGDDEDRVIRADHGMAEARQQALSERLREPSAHEVMGPDDAREHRE